MVRALHIAIDASRTTRARRTGTETYALSLIRALLSIDSPHRFTLYFRDSPPPDLFQNDPSRITQRVIPFPRLWTHARFAAALFADKPDVTFVPAHTLPAIFPGHGVVTIHDLGYRFFPQAHPLRQRLYLELTTRYSARRSSVILANSEATRADLMRLYHANPNKVRVVYPGVEGISHASDSAIAAVRQKYNLPERYLLFLGTLQPRKNLTRLIEAFSAYRAQTGDSSLALVLAGAKGWLSESISLDTPGVVVTSYVPDENVAPLYSGALAFTFPSLYEGFGFPVIEAMRCETPVLCSNTSSLPELVGEAAFLVDPLDVKALVNGIARLVTDPTLRRTLIERGKEQAQRFTWHTAAEQTLAALEEASGKS